MKIAVIGASGMLGSAVTSELLERGHAVTGIARRLERVPVREGLTPKAADVAKVDELSAAIKDHDVVICAYAPGESIGAHVYKAVVEAGWKVKRAFVEAQGQYLINIGGASSLITSSGKQMFEDPRWPKWFFNTAAPEHLRYLKGVTGVAMFENLANAREVILSTTDQDPYSDWPEEAQRQFIQKIADNHDKGEGGRAQFEFFRNDQTLRWSFVSPPWFMRPGERTGKYRISIEKLPLQGELPAGISVADLAVAIADEAEHQLLVWKHWSAARVIN